MLDMHGMTIDEWHNPKLTTKAQRRAVSGAIGTIENGEAISYGPMYSFAVLPQERTRHEKAAIHGTTGMLGFDLGICRTYRGEYL